MSCNSIRVPTIRPENENTTSGIGRAGQTIQANKAVIVIINGFIIAVGLSCGQKSRNQLTPFDFNDLEILHILKKMKCYDLISPTIAKNNLKIFLPFVLGLALCCRYMSLNTLYPATLQGCHHQA